MVIAAMNQVLFLLTVFLAFKWAKKLFDPAVAWVSTMVLLVSPVLWRFTLSGLSTILLLLIFVGLAWCLVLLEQAGHDEQAPKKWRVPLAAGVGLLVGLGALTRYSFAWLLIPVLFFLAVFCGKGRVLLCLAALAAFVGVFGPWMARNYALTRTAFGTAGYSIAATTQFFPADTLERSLRPDLSRANLSDYMRKFVTNAKIIVQNDLPKFGGTWVSAFFLAGLIVPFNNLTLRRVRFFILSCLLVLIPVEAFGRTHLATEVPDVHSENLLVILAPLIFVYGVSFYFVLLEQITVQYPQMRYAVTGLFVAVLSLPFALTLMPPRPPTHAYPPYWPPIIQDISSWMRGKEMMMSDIPWGIAWYGQRPCVWLTANYKKDFYEINDVLSPISAWYVTRRTIDKPFYADWFKGAEDGWERSFLKDTLLRQQVPREFPLQIAPGGLWPEQLYLTDSPLRYIQKTASSK
jgi:4-amino-4-deoxy-L-arabinose transferase-like glycosyltransferase